MYFIQKNFFKVRSCLKAFIIDENFISYKIIKANSFMHLHSSIFAKTCKSHRVTGCAPWQPFKCKLWLFYGCYYCSYISQLCLDIGYLLFMYLFTYILRQYLLLICQTIVNGTGFFFHNISKVMFSENLRYQSH